MENRLFYPLTQFYQDKFQAKIVKLCLDAGFTCPNRDGTIGTGGCIFCSNSGSGEFAGDRRLSIADQLEQQKAQIHGKWKGARYLAYFQAFTNTYAPLSFLESVYTEALQSPGVVGLAIATRPDCVDQDVISLLLRLREKYQAYICIELGLQTANESTGVLIRRGYDNACFHSCVHRLAQYHIDSVAHVLLGLPGEAPSDALSTVSFLNGLPITGVKFASLYVVEDTPLADWYRASQYTPLSMDEYFYWLGLCIANLRPDIVIHRLTGDGKRDTLLAPLWTLHKRRVLNGFQQYLRQNGLFQGKFYQSL